MKKIFLSELKASKFTRSRTFKDKKLLKIFSRHLRSTIKEDVSKIDLGTIHILEKIEDLKARVETYYKSLKFIPSHEFPLLMD
ncbi:hypothetical protein R3W88_014068 [Solanum pinnatisectum]|uniref:Uncharacterized protein n=1 Tax=Solanum pinnatisectum TaxID=50273 RepID=A0AAV9KTI7_9SOLN|nr:hypothetical protein R3W88_014068 [Solanum pinnatisectum]